MLAYYGALLQTYPPVQIYTCIWYTKRRILLLNCFCCIGVKWWLILNMKWSTMKIMKWMGGWFSNTYTMCKKPRNTIPVGEMRMVLFPFNEIVQSVPKNESKLKGFVYSLTTCHVVSPSSMQNDLEGGICNLFLNAIIRLACFAWNTIGSVCASSSFETPASWSPPWGMGSEWLTFTKWSPNELLDTEGRME